MEASMSGIQLSQGQERLIVPLQSYPDDSTTRLEYVTGQNTNGQKRAMDTVVYGTYPVSTGNLIAAGSTQRIIKKAAHGARRNDILQFTSGAGSGVAIQILSCPDVNTMILASTSEFTLVVGDTFDIKRYISPQYDSNGALSVVASSGPIQFDKDAVATVVSKDTSVPANTIGLPVEEVQKQFSDKIFLDYSATNLTSLAYVQLIAATASLSKALTLFDSCGYANVIAFGAAGFEVDKFYIPPGGFNGVIDFPIPAGTRISIKSLQVLDAVGAPLVINAGQFVANLLK